MDVMDIITLFLLLALIYFIFIHEYVLARRKFKCMRCGKCCRLKVNLSKEDIEKIKKAGYTNFLEGKNRLKRVNNRCIFLTLDNGICSCKLEKSAKPEICRNFPMKNGLFGKKYDSRCSSFWNFKKEINTS